MTTRLAAMIACALPTAVLAGPAAASTFPADPLDSPMWEFHAQRLFGKAHIVFDQAVRVQIPVIAENQRVFPVTVDARNLPAVERIVIFADLNPIPVAIDYTTLSSAPFIATRIKLDQRTPVRAAVLTSDGVWHLAGQWIDAAGGGCSAPPVSRVKGDWADHLGEARAAAWNQDGGQTRLRMTFRHPMDTGLVENIAAYNIERLTIRDRGGIVLGQISVNGSVAEDPAFTVMVRNDGHPIAFEATDSAGLQFAGTATAGALRMASANP
ncbi:sulfur-oxidizing protein SoxY [Novosphingobium hassiacum]|uniref:Sulfur-oxidizing protein SoxY n=1 Tax=Novosphingobium hassiacum TaxID=173676 RepID=A0A7W6EUP1_9SPHN|nr:quinoprotein dehydrogenase-associated SoxYZ-like carrier [Novosphingobium hassiacum]MBB3859336.1 sulfur-oxidizing protein SoxY [Novosphingobium hassiacum]